MLIELGCSKQSNRLSGDIDHLVQHWNHRSRVMSRPDRENYLNGDIEFLFDYAVDAPINTESEAWDSTHRPSNIPFVLAERIHTVHRKIGDLLPDDIAGQRYVVCRWNQEPVFVNDVHLMDEIEELVPARLTVGLQSLKCLEEGWRDPIGHSLLNSSIKPCGGFTKGKLYLSLLFGVSYSGGDNIPVSMVESSPEIVNSVTTDDSHFIYDGFVLFRKRGMLAGFCVALKDVGEGPFFLKEGVYFNDVFRGPINL